MAIYTLYQKFASVKEKHPTLEVGELWKITSADFLE